MSSMKNGVILLALLLALMAMVPLVVAQEGGVENSSQNDSNSQYSSCCSPSNSSIISYQFHSGSSNLLDEFGIKIQEKSENMPPLKTYSECPDLIDRIMNEVKITDEIDAVVGLYDFKDHQILLITQGNTVLEVTWDGENVNTSIVIPQLLGEKRVSYSPKKLMLEGQNIEEYFLYSETHTQLYSIPIVSPDSSNILADTYLMKVSRTDEFRNLLQQTIASLHTEGWFYVNYGISITSIDNHSYWWINPGFPGWTKCEYSTENVGVGTTSGQHRTHFKFGCIFDRCQMDMWVSCDAWLNTDNGGSSNRWVSLYPDGCSG
ncbi:MAG: hypothetical protein QMD46_05905 [Methanomicrobiales archaeon]|nr:hypothetical protein [Methanomicrobiales archaeon]MDI6876199.1 hypothetical protein [Methanomicrobiales archaeon]